MPENFLNKNGEGETNGVNYEAVKQYIVKSSPYHLDLQPYMLVHFRAKATFLEALAQQISNWEFITSTPYIVKALKYIENLIDSLLESDETTFACNLRNHHNEICPNRADLTLPELEE